MVRRKDVPLEEFAVDFNPTDFGEEAEIARETIVTILRFIEKDIRPKFETFIQDSPTIEEIGERLIKDQASARYFLELKDTLPQKIDYISSHISGYLSKPGRAVSNTTLQKIHGLILDYAKKEFIFPLEKRLEVLRKKLLDFTEFGLDHTEEETESERGVREAGRDRSQAVDSFIRKNK